MGIGFIKQDNFKNQENMHPDLLSEPVQRTLSDPEQITFLREGFLYDIEPVAEYEISGLVVHRLIYDKWYSLSRIDKTFEIDLCIMWGENISTKAYTVESLKVKQDFRFCIFNYLGSQPVYGDSFSNNHLMAVNNDVRETVLKIRPGDQVYLRGKLINFKANRVDEAKTQFERESTEWHTSTVRSDSGAGACEVIYVEEARILREGNPSYRNLYALGRYGLLLSIFSFIVSLFYSAYFRK
jgi:hypothetical protein